MARKCTKCSKELDVYDKVCAGCGTPRPEWEPPAWLTWLGVGFFFVGLVGVPWMLIDSVFGSSGPEKLCAVLFEDRLAETSGGQRMLVESDKELCVEQATQLENEAPAQFDRMLRCVEKAESVAERSRCG